jgi:hypothetical protein
MPTFRLIAVKANGYGETYSWGDTYEIEAGNYLAAEADVLGREGAGGSRPYVKIVKAWMRDGGLWIQAPSCEGCGNAVAHIEWAGTGEMICWDCCEARQARRPR